MDGRRRGYGRYWAGVLPELGFLLPLLPIVVTALTVIVTLFATGIGMIPIVVGVFILLAALFTARGFGILEIWRLRGAGFPAITPPRWDRTVRQGSSLAKILAPVVDGHYWLYLLHGMIVNPIVGIATWTITIVWTSVALAGLTFWLWPLMFAFGPTTPDIFQWLFPRLDGPLGVILDQVVVFLVGLAFLATLPFVTHGLTWIHHAIGRGMLAAFRSEQLQEEVADLSASRSAAVAAEGTALRRLERDIHDGPQQRLVRMQMDLAAADRALANDPESARELIGQAMTQSREALEELRALSRGFAPPILLDRGLVAALESLAVRATLPTHIESHLPVDLALPPEIERNAYFIAAEALTNVAKHAGAQNAWVRLEVAGESTLDVVVTDDGAGGATALEGHGLSGIRERLRGLGGTMELVSPVGGPTHVIAHLPLPVVASSPDAATR